MTPSRLRACLVTLHWTQRCLADVLGCSEATVRRWLRGACPVPDAVAGWINGIVAVVEAHPPPPAPLSTWHPRLSDLGEPVAWLDATPPVAAETPATEAP